MGLKEMLEGSKGNWEKSPPHVFQAYRITHQSTIEEIPFRFTYNTKFFIPVEVGKINLQKIHPYHGGQNSQVIQENLDFQYKIRCFTILIDVVVKQATKAKYKKNIKPNKFHLGDLTLRIRDVGNEPRRKQDCTKLGSPLPITNPDGKKILKHGNSPRGTNPKNMEFNLVKVS